jgi:hypothetical protein
MRRRRIWVGVATAGLIAAGASGARADVPHFLTEQGRLFDSSNSPVVGPTKFVFTIYDAPTAGTNLWQETQTITLDGGYFSAQLGAASAIPAGTFATAAANGTTLYLGIQVNTDPELSPRQPLLSVPYAYVAENAIGDITPISVTIGGNTVIDKTGHWVGPGSGPSGPVGPTGPAGPTGATGATGPTGPAAGMMQSAVAPGPFAGMALTSGFNTIFPLSFNVGSASSCTVTATTNLCSAGPLPANGYYWADALASDSMTCPLTSTGTAPSCHSPFGAWLSPGFTNTNASLLEPDLPANYTCTAGTTAFSFIVNQGQTYNFGCGVYSLLPLTGSATTFGTGAYCQVAVTCL